MRNITSYLNEKLKSSQQTPANKSDPKMSVQISRARTTVVDSNYWTVETIREKNGLGDVSIAPRRDRPYGPPNRIYEIHVDNGVVGTAIREYPDKLKDGWRNQFILGPGISVAIAFDGYWERHRKLWRLITEEKPWIFWVDDKNVLWRQHWDEEITKEQLSSDVVYVRAIRAWKNVNFADKDQGIVVGYIKTDGTVWYRNYCQQIDYSYMWENPRQITQSTGIAESLNLFITNDYRMGFVVSDNQNKTHWYITGRNWAGMAITPENIIISVNGNIEMIEIEKIITYTTEYISASVGGDMLFLYAMADNSISHMENISTIMVDENEEEYENYGFKILLRLEHDLTELDYRDFSLADKSNTLFTVTKVTRAGRKEYLFETADFNNAVGDLTLTFAGSGTTKGEAEQSVDSFSGAFTPTNLVPTFIPLPEVEVIWNE